MVFKIKHYAQVCKLFTKIMDLELHQKEIDSLRDENIKLRKKVQELEAKIRQSESKN